MVDKFTNKVVNYSLTDVYNFLCHNLKKKYHAI